MLTRACSCVVMVFLGMVVSCSARPTGFDSPLPAERVHAISDQRVPRARSLARLIEQLDHEDAVVRMVAIRRLEDLTDLTFEYQYDAPFQQRQQAVDRWVDWLNTREATGAVRSQ